jgi:hypothetical protein
LLAPFESCVLADGHAHLSYRRSIRQSPTKTMSPTKTPSPTKTMTPDEPLLPDQDRDAGCAQ